VASWVFWAWSPRFALTIPYEGTDNVIEHCGPRTVCTARPPALKSARNSVLPSHRGAAMISLTPRLSDVTFIGSGLNRPECVLATESGDLYTGDWRGGIAHIKPDGSHILYGAKTADIPEGLRPNGIALESDGSFLFANLGTDVGGVWRIDRGSAQRPCQVRPVLAELEGKPILPSNFVTRDAQGRLWLTVSTRIKPRGDDFSHTANTGFIILMDAKGPRIVADALGYTNECYVHPSGDSLWVIETYARQLSRFPLLKNGDLGPKEVVASFGRGGGIEGYPRAAAGLPVSSPTSSCMFGRTAGSRSCWKTRTLASSRPANARFKARRGHDRRSTAFPHRRCAISRTWPSAALTSKRSIWAASAAIKSRN
jgi:sugar lactone lactonase YvrE